MTVHCSKTITRLRAGVDSNAVSVFVDISVWVWQIQKQKQIQSTIWWWNMAMHCSKTSTRLRAGVIMMEISSRFGFFFNCMMISVLFRLYDEGRSENDGIFHQDLGSFSIVVWLVGFNFGHRAFNCPALTLVQFRCSFHSAHKTLPRPVYMSSN